MLAQTSAEIKPIYETELNFMSTVLSPKEAARYLGISEPLIYQLCRRKDFPAVRLSARRIVIPTNSLDDWLSQQALHKADAE